MNIALWIAQGLLSASLLWSTYTKWFTPVDQLAAMWPWTADNPVLTKVTGVFDLLAALGLILPMLLKIQPRLTVYAAYGFIALMVAAVIFHVSRGEGAQTLPNFVFMAIAGFIAWGRAKNP